MKPYKTMHGMDIQEVLDKSTRPLKHRTTEDIYRYLRDTFIDEDLQEYVYELFRRAEESDGKDDKCAACADELEAKEDERIGLVAELEEVHDILEEQMREISELMKAKRSKGELLVIYKSLEIADNICSRNL